MADGSAYFDGSLGDYYSRTSPFNFNAAYTVSLWAKLEAGRTDYHHYFHVGGNFGFDGVTDFVGLNNDGVTYRSGCDGGATATFPTNGTFTAGTWYLVQMVRESATSLKIYLDGALMMTLTDDVSARTAPLNIFLGSYNTAPCRGFIAAVKIWTSALNGAELATEGGYYQAVKAAPWAVWPLFNDHNDDSGNGRDLTVVGTVGFDLGPPITWSPTNLVTHLVTSPLRW